MSNIQERAINPAEQAEFDQYAALGLKNLGFQREDAEADAVIAAIGSFVEKWQSDQRKPLGRLLQKKTDPVDVALSLGTIWGNQVVRALGWQWTCLLQNGQEVYAVVSPDRAYVAYPTYWIREFLQNAQKENTIVLLFNMMKAGNLPPSTPNALLALG